MTDVPRVWGPFGLGSPSSPPGQAHSGARGQDRVGGGGDIAAGAVVRVGAPPQGAPGAGPLLTCTRSESCGARAGLPRAAEREAFESMEGARGRGGSAERQGRGCGWPQGRPARVRGCVGQAAGRDHLGGRGTAKRKPLRRARGAGELGKR